MNFLSLNLKIYRNKLITLILIILGIISLVVNLNYNYDLSFSFSNKKAYDSLSTLSGYPKGLVTLTTKEFGSLNGDNFSDIILWLDESNSSKTEIMRLGDDLMFKVLYNQDFNLSKYLNKIVLVPNANPVNIKINFVKKILEITLEKKSQYK